MGVPGEPGDRGELKGLSLSNTGDPPGCSTSGVLAAELRGELGIASSGYNISFWLIATYWTKAAHINDIRRKSLIFDIALAAIQSASEPF